MGWPSTYSSARYGWPSSATPASYRRAMCGCASARGCRARARSARPGLRARRADERQLQRHLALERAVGALGAARPRPCRHGRARATGGTGPTARPGARSAGGLGAARRGGSVLEEVAGLDARRVRGQQLAQRVARSAGAVAGQRSRASALARAAAASSASSSSALSSGQRGDASASQRLMARRPMRRVSRAAPAAAGAPSPSRARTVRSVTPSASRDLGFRQAAEVAHLDHARQPRVEPRQSSSASCTRGSRPRRLPRCRPCRCPASRAARRRRGARAALARAEVDDDRAHRARRVGQEVRAVARAAAGPPAPSAGKTRAPARWCRAACCARWRQPGMGDATQLGIEERRRAGRTRCGRPRGPVRSAVSRLPWPCSISRTVKADGSEAQGTCIISSADEDREPGAHRRDEQAEQRGEAVGPNSPPR